MWPFSKKSKCTNEEFASLLIDIFTEESSECLESLIENVKDKWDLDSEEIDILNFEIKLAYLWISSHIFSENKAVLDAFYNNFFEIIRNSYEENRDNVEDLKEFLTDIYSHLTARHKEYYEAFDCEEETNKGYLSVSFKMCQNFFPKRVPVLDIFLSQRILVHLFSFQKIAIECFGKCRII